VKFLRKTSFERQLGKTKSDKDWELNKLGIALIVVILVIGGIGAYLFLSSDGDGGGETYHGDVSEYLLTEDEIEGGWTKSEIREPNIEIGTMESGRAINFDRNRDNLTVAVVVFESIEDARQSMDDRRSTYESYGGYTERDLGEESISGSFLGRTFFDVRIGNVHVQVYGNISLTNIREYAEQQVEKIEG